MTNKVIYTVLTGDDASYSLKEMAKVPEGWRAICFADRPLSSKTWEVIRIDGLGLDSPRLSRRPKILYFEYLDDCGLSVYLDSKFLIPRGFSRFMENLAPLLKDNDFIIMDHPKRTCIYQEADHCISVKLDRRKIIRAQMRRYKAEGMPASYGLWAAGIMIRRHKVASLEDMMKTWWIELENGSKRDLLSFSYARWKHPDVRMTSIEWAATYNLFMGRMK